MNASRTTRFARRFLGSAALAVLVLGVAAASAGASPIRHFVVAERPSIDPCVFCDSFILPLSDPRHIARALEIIADIEAGGNGGGDSSVTVEIIGGSDGVNRDVLAPGEPLWSWHVTEFLGFGTILIFEVPSFSPGFVEEFLAEHPERGEEGFGVPFRDFTVVAEVPEPGSLALLATGAVLLALRRRGRSAAARAP